MVKVPRFPQLFVIRTLESIFCTTFHCRNLQLWFLFVAAMTNEAKASSASFTVTDIYSNNVTRNLLTNIRPGWKFFGSDKFCHVFCKIIQAKCFIVQVHDSISAARISIIGNNSNKLLMVKVPRFPQLFVIWTPKSICYKTFHYRNLQ